MEVGAKSRLAVLKFSLFYVRASFLAARGYIGVWVVEVFLGIRAVGRKGAIDRPEFA